MAKIFLSKLLQLVLVMLAISAITFFLLSALPGNAALYRITLSRLRWDTRTQAYLQRRIKEGKTRREVIRCIKRYIAREVFRLLRTPAPALPAAA